MYQSTLKSRNLRRSLLLGAASAAAIAIASPAAAQGQNVETVVVTGSRIPQVGLYSSSPVTALGQQALQLSGSTKVENLLNNLPSVLASNSSTDSNGASGTATVDLRGLGVNRTLVLVNGNRLMPGDPYTGSAADLNTIPSALVERVEVLTGGASAVYGSDAIAGVVNFIMRKDFEGVELDGSYSIHNIPNGQKYANPLGVDYTPAPTNWWGGATKNLSLLLGTNTSDGKGNITVYASYRNVQPVLEKNADFASCALWSDFNSSLYCGGSSNYNRWRSFDNRASANPNGTDTATDLFGGTPGVLTPFAGQYYNYGPLNYLMRNDERYTGGYFAHYKVNKALDVYSSMMFLDDHTNAQIAPSAIFAGSGPVQYHGIPNTHYYQINCSNPNMTAQQNSLLCGQTTGSALVTSGPIVAALGHSYWNGAGNITPGQSLLDLRIRNVLGGPRIDDLRHTAYRFVVGTRGDLGDGWAYDFHGQYGLTLYSENYQNDLSGIRVENSLEVDPTTGKCYAAQPDSNGIINDPNCVPWNIFQGFSKPPSYVTSPGFQQGYTEEQILTGNVTGDLGQWGVQSPWASSPVAVALGAEYRAEYLKLDTSYNYQIGDLTGQGTKILPVPKSGFNVAEGFGELRIPLVQNKPLAEDVTLHLSGRYSSYSSVGAETTWSVGAEWQPVDDIRFRASYSHAGRAPNVTELYQTHKIQLFGGNDPCASGASSLTPQCQAVWTAFGLNATSAAATLACPANQCNQFVGGNSSLKAEKADTLTLGAVLTPTFIDGFTATIDYFNIQVDNYIDTIAPSTSLAGCYGASATAAALAYYCPFVHRSPATGALYGAGYVSDLNLNLPYIKTAGVDFEATYTTDLGDITDGLLDNAGSLTAHFIGTWQQKYVTKPSSVSLGTDSTYDCTGYYGLVCQVPRPSWRHQMRFTWSTPWDVDFSLNWRYMSGVNLDVNQANSLMGGGLPLTTCAAGSSIAGASVSTAFYGGDCGPGAKIGAKNYFDLAFSWSVKEGVSLRGGVNNVLASRPPVVGSTFAGTIGNANTYPGTYDAMGREFFIAATIKY